MYVLNNRLLKRIAAISEEEEKYALQIMYKPAKEFIRNNIYDIFPDIKKKYIDKDKIKGSIEKALRNNKEYVALIRNKLNIKMHKFLQYIKFFVEYYFPEIQDYCNRITERYNKNISFNNTTSKNKSFFSLDIFKSLFNNEQYDKLLPYMFPKLREYVEQNFRSICKQLELKKSEYDPQSYESSWNDDPTALPIEQKYLSEWIIKYGFNVIKDIIQNNMNSKDVPEALKIIKDHIYGLADKFVENNNDLVIKIREYILNKNRPVRKQRAKDLLTANDGLLINKPNAINIDYNAADDIIRDKPILILRSKKDNKDYIFIGNTGDSHSQCMKTKVNIPMKDNYMCQAYLLGNIAFIDSGTYLGYQEDEVINLLRNHPQIKKIYTVPNEGKSTRLAKKV